MKIFKKLFHRRRFTPLEEKILNAVAQALPPEARERFEAQVAEIVHVQRLRSKEIDLYPGKHGMPKELLFPHGPEEKLLALVHIRVPERQEKVRAEVWVVGRRIFSIELNKSIPKGAGENAQVEKVELIYNPMKPEEVEALSDQEKQKQILDRIYSKLPEEYFEIIGKEKEITVNDWKVYGIEKIRKACLDDANYYILAEKEDLGVVGVKEDEYTGTLYFLCYDDKKGQRIIIPLKEFLEPEFDGWDLEGKYLAQDSEA